MKTGALSSSSSAMLQNKGNQYFRSSISLVERIVLFSFFSYVLQKVSGADLTTGLVAYYPFDGNAHDISGHGLHCINHLATPAPNRFGYENKAYYFDGITSYMEIADGSAFKFINQLSISAWIKPGNNQSYRAHLIHNYFTDGTGFSIRNYAGTINKFNLIAWSPSSPIQLAHNEWNHAAWVKNGSIVKTYLNGVLALTNTLSPSGVVSSGNLPVTIGAWNSAQTQPASGISRYLNATIDDLRIYNRALSAADVFALNVYESPNPTSQPTGTPTNQPSGRPSRQPSGQPTKGPTGEPTGQPSQTPTGQPSKTPTAEPSGKPSRRPSGQPTKGPIGAPTGEPTGQPSGEPTGQPSQTPTGQPSKTPTAEPSGKPSRRPSGQPTKGPTGEPTGEPTGQPTGEQPLSSPTMRPSSQPSSHPTDEPSKQPTSQPTCQPTEQPLSSVTMRPSSQPSSHPTDEPSKQPTSQLTCQPTEQPLSSVTMRPSSQPSSHPTDEPSKQPTSQPTCQPTEQPLSSPTVIVLQPSSFPSRQPSKRPFGGGSRSQPPSEPFVAPTPCPTSQSTSTSTISLTVARIPTCTPTLPPALFPFPSTNYPSSILPSVATYSLMPSFIPNVRPSQIPTAASSVFYFTSSTNAKDWKVSITLFGSFSFNQEAVSRLDPSGPSEGVSSIIFGSRALPLTTMIDASSPSSSHYPVAQISPTYKRDATTRSAVIPGDMNGDGFNDLIVCYPLSSSCYIFFGSGEGGLRNVRIGVTIYGLTGSYLGFAVSGADDVNEDGYADVIISALVGKACYVIYGRPQSSWKSEMRVSEMRSGGKMSEGADGYKILADASTTLTGLSVAGLGDMNGDGRGDLAISVQRGASYIVYVIWGEGREGGKDVSLSEVGNGVKGFKVFGEEGYYTGLSISRVGDVNEDGLADLVIGAIPYPGRGKSPVQKSYLILGSSSISDMVLGEGMVGKGVVMLVGGGLIVSGPGDVNNDGIEDIMISDVKDYLSKGNAYMISYPGKMSSPPSFLPSSLPSSPPSNRPSSEPSSSPPTTSPSIGSFNSSFPPSITSNSSMYPSLKPSARVRPTRSPSHRPSNQPISYAPSALPTILATRAPSYRPTTIRTKQPNLTLPPSRAPIRSIITPSPSIRLDQRPFPSPPPSSVPLSEYSVRLINATSMNRQGIIPGREGSNEIFEISSMSKDGKRRSGWSGTIIGGRGRKIYRIYPKDPSQPVNRIILQDFDSSKDVIDLSHISKIGSKADLTYLTHPLTLFLPDNQRIILSSYDLMASITESNFIFQLSSSSSSDSSSPFNFSDIDDWLSILAYIVPIMAVVGCLGASYLFGQQEEKVQSHTKMVEEEEEAEETNSDQNTGQGDLTHAHLQNPSQAQNKSHFIDADSRGSDDDFSDDTSLLDSFSVNGDEIDKENEKDSIIDEYSIPNEEDASLLLPVRSESIQSAQFVDMFEDVSDELDEEWSIERLLTYL